MTWYLYHLRSSLEIHYTMVFMQRTRLTPKYVILLGLLNRNDLPKPIKYNRYTTWAMKITETWIYEVTLEIEEAHRHLPLILPSITL